MPQAEAVRGTGSRRTVSTSDGCGGGLSGPQRRASGYRVPVTVVTVMDPAASSIGAVDSAAPSDGRERVTSGGEAAEGPEVVTSGGEAAEGLDGARTSGGEAAEDPSGARATSGGEAAEDPGGSPADGERPEDAEEDSEVAVLTEPEEAEAEDEESEGIGPEAEEEDGDGADEEPVEDAWGTPDAPSLGLCDWLLGKAEGRRCLCEARFELPVEICPPTADSEDTLQWTNFCPEHALAILLGLRTFTDRDLVMLARIHVQGPSSPIRQEVVAALWGELDGASIEPICDDLLEPVPLGLILVQVCTELTRESHANYVHDVAGELTETINELHMNRLHLREELGAERAECSAATEEASVLRDECVALSAAAQGADRMLERELERSELLQAEPRPWDELPELRRAALAEAKAETAQWQQGVEARCEQAAEASFRAGYVACEASGTAGEALREASALRRQAEQGAAACNAELAEMRDEMADLKTERNEFEDDLNECEREAAARFDVLASNAQRMTNELVDAKRLVGELQRANSGLEQGSAVASSLFRMEAELQVQSVRSAELEMQARYDATLSESRHRRTELTAAGERLRAERTFAVKEAEVAKHAESRLRNFEENARIEHAKMHRHLEIAIADREMASEQIERRPGEPLDRSQPPAAKWQGWRPSDHLPGSPPLDRRPQKKVTETDRPPSGVPEGDLGDDFLSPEAIQRTGGGQKGAPNRKPLPGGTVVPECP